MRRWAFYLSVALLAFSQSIPFVYSQNSKQRSFFIELQPDSPLLIRDLSATILPNSKRIISPTMEVTFYVENRSEKKVLEYSFQDPAEDDANYEDYNVRGFDLQDLLPGESRRQKLTMMIEGKSLVYRIKEVKSEDGTKWKAKPFKSGKAKKSTRIIAIVQKSDDEQSKEVIVKRAVAREGWTSPVFADRVVKVLDGTAQVIDGVDVQIKLHELKKERLDMVESCDIQNDNLEIAYNELDYDVEKFTTYEVKGKIFAYEISYAFIQAEDGYEIGAGVTNSYIDEEGNGKFKLYCGKAELKSLPKWVKTLAMK